MQQSVRMLAGMIMLAALVACGQAPAADGTSPAPSPATNGSPATDSGGTLACADPDIRGTITGVALTDDGATLSIEGQVEEDTSYDRASVTVNQQTQISSQQGGELTLDDLQNGVQVEACFTGPVMESLPVQATASGIVILQAE